MMTCSNILMTPPYRNPLSARQLLSSVIELDLTTVPNIVSLFL